uniref:Uncharacterized protein n=1 Tax=Anguilla anguilla TaxID=7936 RepID=A0A0E9VSD8_ANGAN
MSCLTPSLWLCKASSPGPLWVTEGSVHK